MSSTTATAAAPAANAPTTATPLTAAMERNRAGLVATLRTRFKPLMIDPQDLKWPRGFVPGESNLNDWIHTQQPCLAVLDRDTSVTVFLPLGVRNQGTPAVASLVGVTMTPRGAQAAPMIFHTPFTDANLGATTIKRASHASLKTAQRETDTLAAPGISTTDLTTTKLLPLPFHWIEILTSTPNPILPTYNQVRTYPFEETLEAQTPFKDWFHAAATATPDSTNPSAAAQPQRSSLSIPTTPVDIELVATADPTLFSWLTERHRDLNPSSIAYWDAWLNPKPASDADRTTRPLTDGGAEGDDTDRTRHDSTSTTTATGAATAAAAPTTNPVTLAVQELLRDNRATPLEQAQRIGAMLGTIINNPTAPPPPPPPVATGPTSNQLGNKIWHIRGWANLSPTDDLPPFWDDFITLRNKTEQETLIQSTLIPTLTNVDSGLNDTILHKGFVDTVVNLKFAPGTDKSEKHVGLGPLAYVARDQSDLSRLDTWQDNLAYSTSVTPSDVERAKLGAPSPPSTSFALTECLDKMSRVLSSLFGEKCLLRTEVISVAIALRAQGGLLDTPAFQRQFTTAKAPSILFAVHEATRRFFGTQTTEAILRQGILPQCNLDWVVRNIQNRQQFTYDYIPDMFYSQQALQLRRQQNITPATTSPPNPPQQQQQRRDRPNTGQPIRNNTGINQTLRQALEKWKQDNGQAPIKMNNMLLPALNTNIQELCQECRLTDEDCARWAILGVCGGRCQKNHTKQISPTPTYMARLVDAIPTMRPSQKPRNS